MVPCNFCSGNEENENVIGCLTWGTRHIIPFKRNKSHYLLHEVLSIIGTVFFFSHLKSFLFKLVQIKCYPKLQEKGSAIVHQIDLCRPQISDYGIHITDYRIYDSVFSGFFLGQELAW